MYIKNKIGYFYRKEANKINDNDGSWVLEHSPEMLGLDSIAVVTEYAVYSIDVDDALIAGYIEGAVFVIPIADFKIDFKEAIRNRAEGLKEEKGVNDG